MADQYIKNEQEEYRYIDRFHPEYPEKLQEIPNPPAGIYVKGSLPDPRRPGVAIVGSRICSQYGRLAAREFGAQLARAGVQIISGMARGIDGIAQEAACSAGGSTFGVLGCGINVVYPAQNRELFARVEQTGGLISEFSPDAAPIAKQFPSRNRIISGLSDLVLVIEAKERSGTGITVSRALEQGRDVYALPGRIHDICSAGCNALIAQGAGIALSPGQILEALSEKYDLKTAAGESPENPENGAESGFVREADGRILCLEKLERVVYSVVDLYPRGLDRLSRESGLPVPELMNVLFHLQMKGLIREEGNRCYVRL